MKIGYLGAGTWGFCLANLLASKGYKIKLWARNPELYHHINVHREHPKLPGHLAHAELSVTRDLFEALDDVDLIVESVTTSGIRSVFTEIKHKLVPSCPIVVTSKGIEKGTHLLSPEIIFDIFGPSIQSQVAMLSGPSHAEEVISHLPASVVSSSSDLETMNLVAKTFFTPTFRVYPNADLLGVAFGAAMKNIIAIACGISDGLGFGDSTKAALMTRGLHEIRKLSFVKVCNPDTLTGLSGLGDLCVTCLSHHSRNYRFGKLLASGLGAQAAKETIGMAVEGASTCLAAFELGQKTNTPLPITEAIYDILVRGLSPRDAVKNLLTRSVKEEHL